MPFSNSLQIQQHNWNYSKSDSKLIVLTYTMGQLPQIASYVSTNYHDHS